MADKLDMKSMDITQGNIEKIKALFPSAVTEAMGDNGKVRLAIDFDALKQELSERVLLSLQYYLGLYPLISYQAYLPFLLPSAFFLAFDSSFCLVLKSE